MIVLNQLWLFENECSCCVPLTLRALSNVSPILTILRQRKCLALLTVIPWLVCHSLNHQLRQREPPTLLTVVCGLTKRASCSLDCRSWAKEGHLCSLVAMTVLQGTVRRNKPPAQLVIAKRQTTLMPQVPPPGWPMNKCPSAATVVSLSKVPSTSSRKW